jgi:hypothetical protein
MATRTIVTAQPDVTCDVCERRLLRGEQPDVFLAAGRRRIVCELCAPRAAHEGWQRERDTQSLDLPPMRPRRGRGLLERLRARQVTRPAGEAVAGSPTPSSGERPSQPYDVFAEEAQPADRGHPDGNGHAEMHAHSDQAGYAAEHAHPEGYAQSEVEPVVGVNFAEAGSETAALPDDASIAYMQEAIAVFNASEFPRRVAGVARSLGAPAVSVRSAEHLSSVVVIVVAWELCWYRYEIDLSEPVAQARMLAQGTELAELAREDRLANAAAAAGKLALSTL